MFLTDQACLLAKAPSGENSSRLVFFLREYGLQTVFLKGRRKGPSGQLPDLFEIGELTIRKSGPDGIGFFSEFTLQESFKGIGLSYRHLVVASSLTRFFEQNLQHMESFEQAWLALHQALLALSTKPAPEATLFKTVFLFARQEGYPVSRGWLNGLSTTNRIEVEAILREPLEALHLPKERVTYWLDRLSIYLESDTAIYPPKSLGSKNQPTPP